MQLGNGASQLMLGRMMVHVILRSLSRRCAGLKVMVLSLLQLLLMMRILLLLAVLSGHGRLQIILCLTMRLAAGGGGSGSIQLRHYGRMVMLQVGGSQEGS